MTWPDIAVLAAIAVSVLVGLLRGFITEVFSLLTWAAAFFVAYTYGGEIALLMQDQVTLPSARMVIGFAGLFLAVLLVGGLLNYLIGRLVEATGLSGTDRLVGGFFGAARGLAMVIAFLLVAGFTPLPADPWWKESSVIHRLMPMVQWAQTFLPESVQQQLDFDPKPPVKAGTDSKESGGKPSGEGEEPPSKRDADQATAR